jgi:hypothetical protein
MSGPLLRGYALDLEPEIVALADAQARASGRSRAAVVRDVLAAALVPVPDAAAQAAAPLDACSPPTPRLRDLLAGLASAGWQEAGPGAAARSLLLRRGARWAVVAPAPGGWAWAEVGA